MKERYQNIHLYFLCDIKSEPVQKPAILNRKHTTKLIVYLLLGCIKRLHALRPIVTYQKVVNIDEACQVLFKDNQKLAMATVHYHQM